MQSWLPLFVVMACLAIVLQTVILTAMFFLIRRQGRRAQQIAEEFQARVMPILSRMQLIVDDAQPRISSMMADAAEITNVARSQVQLVDRVMAETIDRLRLQVVHLDQMLTGTLETIEDAGTKLRRTLWRPLQSVSALVRGVQVGLDVFRGGRRPSESPSEQPDESLFI